MFHIAAHLPEILTEAKEAVQNVASVAMAQVSLIKNKDLKNLSDNLFVNDPMRDDNSMPVGADIDMTGAGAYEESPLAGFSLDEIPEKHYSEKEMDKMVEDFFSQI